MNYDEPQKDDEIVSISDATAGLKRTLEILCRWKNGIVRRGGKYALETDSKRGKRCMDLRDDVYASAKDFKENILHIAGEKYGLPLPGNISACIEEELFVIAMQRLETTFSATGKLCNHLQEQGLTPRFRGAVGASLVAFLLDISDIDPLKHGLYWEVLFGGQRGRDFAITFELHQKDYFIFCNAVENLFHGKYEKAAEEIIGGDFETCCGGFLIRENDGIGRIDYEVLMEDEFFPQTAEDLLSFLLSRNLDRVVAVEITEYVRRGMAFFKGIPENYCAAMENVGISKRYFEALGQIRFLPTRAYFLQKPYFF